jgi:hypothetical protein
MRGHMSAAMAQLMGGSEAEEEFRFFFNLVFHNT